MAVNYQKMRAAATRQITANGAEFQVFRPGSVNVIGGVECPEPETRFKVIGVRSDYQPGEIDGSVIQSGDVRIVFTADKELKIGDLVDVDGKQYRIEKPNPIKPATLLLCYRAQLRS